MLRSILVMALIVKASLLAHTGVGLTSDFSAGFFHPIHGGDHILAMFAVGIWAAQLGGKALWSVPLSFLIMMVFGAFLGTYAIGIPFAEEWILASILLLGLFIVFKVKMAVLFSSISVGLLAVFHGYTHGLEMPLSVNGIEYGVGFVMATTMLHIAGVVTGKLMYRKTMLKSTVMEGSYV